MHVIIVMAFYTKNIEKYNLYIGNMASTNNSIHRISDRESILVGRENLIDTFVLSVQIINSY